MAELLSSSGDGFHWNVNFVRPVQDWELESVVTFLDFIYSGLVRGNRVINYAGNLLPVGFLMLNLFIRFCVLPPILFSLGNLDGG